MLPTTFNRIKSAYGRLPLWMSVLLLMPVVYVFFQVIPPTAEWIHDHPVGFVALVGTASYLLVLGGMAWELHFGQHPFAEVKLRIRSRTVEPDDLPVALWIVLGLMIVTIVIVVVAAFAVSTPRPETRPILIIVVGGLAAGVTAPFLVPPTIAVAGLLRRSPSFEVTFTVKLAAPRPDALTLRSELERMPPPMGLARLKPVEGGRWRARPIHLGRILMRYGTTYARTLHDPQSLDVESRTDAEPPDISVSQPGPDGG